MLPCVVVSRPQHTPAGDARPRSRTATAVAVRAPTRGAQSRLEPGTGTPGALRTPGKPMALSRGESSRAAVKAAQQKREKR